MHYPQSYEGLKCPGLPWHGKRHIDQYTSSISLCPSECKPTKTRDCHCFYSVSHFEIQEKYTKIPGPCCGGHLIEENPLVSCHRILSSLLCVCQNIFLGRLHHLLYDRHHPSCVGGCLRTVGVGSSNLRVCFSHSLRDDSPLKRGAPGSWSVT